MMNNPVDCEKIGRKVQGTERAKVFEISQLLDMYRATRQYPTGPILRAWTYVLTSCCLFLRKSEAVNLKIGDIEVPCDRATGKQIIENGLPKYLFVNIRRSKTDQESAGKHGTSVVCILYMLYRVLYMGGGGTILDVRISWGL